MPGYYIKCTKCGSTVTPCDCMPPPPDFFAEGTIPAIPIDALHVYDQTEVNEKCKAVRKKAISDCKAKIARIIHRHKGCYVCGNYPSLIEKISNVEVE